MFRGWMIVSTFYIVPCGAIAQCTIDSPIRNLTATGYISGGHGGYGDVRVQIVGQCPGNSNANVKFKLASIDKLANLLVVSPSSGTTPLSVIVAVNPYTVGQAGPGTSNNIGVYFRTVDQSPPSTAFVGLTLTLVGLDPPVIQSVVNTASMDPVITPGGLVSIIGNNLGPPNTSATFDQGGQYPASLGNTTVTFNGIQAALLSTSLSQINAVSPYEVAGQQNVQVVVTHHPQTTAQQVSDPFTVPETDNSVAIFATAPQGNGPPGIATCNGQGCTPNSTATPAPAGSIIVLFAGVGPIWNNAAPDGSVSAYAQLYSPVVSLTVGGQPATLLYYGTAPFQSWGVFQVNAIVPTGLASGPQPVVLTIGQTSSKPVTLYVE